MPTVREWFRGLRLWSAWVRRIAAERESRDDSPELQLTGWSLVLVIVALIPLFAVLAWAAWRPTALAWWYNLLLGGWQPDPTLSQLLTLLMVFAALKFTVALLIMKWMPLRIALTPAATKHRRVRRRAIAIFKAAAERRTSGRTGILVYLSMAERRAEIIGDEAITKVTTPETWGEAMAALLVEVKQGRVGDGIVAAVERVGAVLAEHFPRSTSDTNEIPDKLIEL